MGTNDSNFIKNVKINQLNFQNNIPQERNFAKIHSPKQIQPKIMNPNLTLHQKIVNSFEKSKSISVKEDRDISKGKLTKF